MAATEQKPRIFSGIQPTGRKTLGNYSGGFRQYAQTQETGDGFFCIVDLHSISVDYDPEDTLRYYALRLREAGMIRSSPEKIIANGTDWRFLTEVRRDRTRTASEASAASAAFCSIHRTASSPSSSEG